MITIRMLQVPEVLPKAYWDHFLSQVSAERRAQASRFVRQADAYRSVLGEILTRVTLSKLTGLRSHELSFTRNSYGKPSLSHHSDVPFNVSHSGDWIALISGGADELGVDVEKIAPIDMQIAERFFSPTESQFLAAVPVDRRLETFYRLWTLKESYIKAVGMGLSIPLDSFAILPDEGGVWHCEQAAEYRFHSHRLDEGHMLAACSAGGELPSQPEIITLEELYTELV
ncbi:4'-phosphopantetheinyl transferase superfamily protein [Paenibacillus sp. 1781tsa1]|uniref:4'-phosphopantetheinyl transferase family protein n=1 Tax=Paenibacillus sp. 1781tsa1 TaxID=2953810 RepID=UPI0020A0A814|nr:4'-phosphopantetheinyl transferase superfamily protein [Paenibacillus sp. 1781tsa1]MCP1187364.1 4'-phosphopantetheinyl transferase superfamily protein [Paenibacillus sp. 1781tsa1]